MSQPPNFDDPKDSAAALSKMFGTSDGRPALNWFGGGTFAIRGDLEPIELLFQVEGVTLTSVTSPEKPQLTARHLVLFKEAEGDSFLDVWDNPFTGQQVQVEPADIAEETVQLSDLMPWYITDEKAVALIEHHRSGRDSSIQQFVAQRDALEDEAQAAVSTVGTWQTASAWWPWMQMGDVEGYLFTRMFTRKYASSDELPDDLRARLLDQFAGALN